MASLQEELDRRARELGADYFGVGNLEPARGLIEEQGGEFLAEYPRAVSVGIRIPEGIVEQLPNRQNPMVARTYDYTIYTTVNQSLDRIALAMAGLVQEAGFDALAVPASQTPNEAKLLGIFSHKLAAHQAGLGWIGKSCLLITPDHGPRVRWVTVLTDAPLKPGKPMSSRCRQCTLCVEACPPQAFTGRAFHAAEPRDARFNAHACEDYRLEQAKIVGVRICGMCVYVCPYGRKQLPVQGAVR